MSDDFRPLTDADGYLPIADHGLLGDGRTAALVGRDGGVSWLCAPQFDSPPVFCGLLDRDRGGRFDVIPDGLRDARQRYLDDTGVLVTELRTGTGLLEITDALTLREGADLAVAEPAARGELLRRLRVPEGEVGVEIAVRPRGATEVDRSGDGWRLRSPAWPGVTLHLAASLPLTGPRTRLRLAAGQEVYVWLRWDADEHPDPARRLSGTAADWRRWTGRIRYQGPQAAMVRRSAITLKLLDYVRNGAIVAAATSSLPERVGGVRNWDYRYTWVRDAAFSTYALRRVGLRVEADQFLSWVLRAVERDGEPRILYNLDGHPPPDERLDADLSGYRGSAPVRWGNDAAVQTQHDVYGEILDCAYQWVAAGGDIDADMWRWLHDPTETARDRWRRPDHGIWEVRAEGRRFTYSVAMCQVALDRAARLAQRLDLPGDRGGWASEAERIRRDLLERAWDPRLGAITESLREDGETGPAALDASVLALPLRRLLPGDHPKMVATTAAVADRLGAGDGLLYRYLPHASPDGLDGDEGAFLLCSFWLVDNLVLQGRRDEAGELYESLCRRANPLGLLPEQIDPATGAFLGNFPQAFSHVGVITSGIGLARAGVAG